VFRRLRIVVSNVMMDRRVILRLLAILAWAGAITARPICANQPGNKPAAAPRTEAARLLEWGDHYSPTALDKARAYHDELRTKPDCDAQIQYALALVLIRQHGYQEAVERLEAMLVREPEGVHLWRAKIWSEMAMHKEREALAEIRSLADVLAGQRVTALTDAEAEARRATVEFLARVFGFLEVPRTNASPADEIRAAKLYLLARLGDDRASFNQQEELVAERFAKDRAALENLRARRLAAGKTKQVALKQQKKIIDETETNVDYDTEKVKSNTIAEVDRHNQSAESLQKYLVACQFRLDAVHKAILTNQDLLAQQALASEQSAQGVTTGRNSLVMMARNSNQIQNLLFRLAAEEVALIQQITQLNEQLQTTVAQRNLLLDTGERTTAELKSQAATLKRDEKRIERAEQAEAKKIAAEQHKTLLTKQTSFAAFEPFPFETEKQRVLGTADP